MLTQQELDRFVAMERLERDAIDRCARECRAAEATSFPLNTFAGLAFSLVGDLCGALVGALVLFAMFG